MTQMFRIQAIKEYKGSFLAQNHVHIKTTSFKAGQIVLVTFRQFEYLKNCMPGNFIDTRLIETPKVSTLKVEVPSEPELKVKRTRTRKKKTNE